jgi:hypothetical protein
MRILDDDSGESLQDIILFLTKDEAKELKDSLESMLRKFGNHEHAHINDTEYIRELTVTLYDPNDLSQFNE